MPCKLRLQGTGEETLQRHNGKEKGPEDTDEAQKKKNHPEKKKVRYHQLPRRRLNGTNNGNAGSRKAVLVKMRQRTEKGGASWEMWQ